MPRKRPPSPSTFRRAARSNLSRPPGGRVSAAIAATSSGEVWRHRDDGPDRFGGDCLRLRHRLTGHDVGGDLGRRDDLAGPHRLAMEERENFQRVNAVDPSQRRDVDQQYTVRRGTQVHPTLPRRGRRDAGARYRPGQPQSRFVLVQFPGAEPAKAQRDGEHPVPRRGHQTVGQFRVHPRALGNPLPAKGDRGQ